MSSVDLLPSLAVIVVWAIVSYGIIGRIFERAGFSRWLGLISTVPFFGLLLLVWFALVDWPNLPPRFGTMKRRE